MYLEETEGKLPGQRIKIKYDCNNGNKLCKSIINPIYKVAKKNYEDNNGKHICKICNMKSSNPMKKKENVEKIKKTNLERYGTTCNMNTAELIEKRKKQFENKEFVAKRTKKTQETCLEKYGVSHVKKVEEIKEKAKQTMLERYGVEYSYQSKEIMDKMKASNMEKYGVENVASLPETRDKMAATSLERYGVEHYNQLPEMKEYLAANCKEWLAESYKNPWGKGLQRPEEVKNKLSKIMSEKLVNGELNSNQKKFYTTGYYCSDKCKKHSAFFRSSLELIMHNILDEDNDVLWYENEPFSIEYEKEPNVIRNYVPDFFVYRKSGILELVEIKPAFRMREKEVMYKVDAAKIFCEKYGFQFLYIDEKYLKNKGKNVKELILLPKVKLIE